MQGPGALPPVRRPAQLSAQPAVSPSLRGRNRQAKLGSAVRLAAAAAGCRGCCFGSYSCRGMSAWWRHCATRPKCSCRERPCGRLCRCASIVGLALLRRNEAACGGGPSCYCYHATTLPGHVLVAGARLLSWPDRCRCCRSAGLGCRRQPQRLHHRVLLLQLLRTVLLLRLAESREPPRLLPRPALAAKRSSSEGG